MFPLQLRFTIAKIEVIVNSLAEAQLGEICNETEVYIKKTLEYSVYAVVKMYLNIRCIECLGH